MQNPSMFAALLAASLLLQAPSQAVTTTRPTLAITYPKANLSVTDAAITVSGTTKDKVAVTNVWCQLNGAAWTTASTTNGCTNWTAGVTLTPGPNTVKAYAVDSSGNASLTNTVTVDYVLTAPLTVQVTPAGFGTVTPDYNGKSLDIGAQYSMTAKADKGFAFANWSWSGGSTNKTKLNFQMASDLALTANFVDVTPPVLIILSPKVHQNVTDAAFTVTGKASDNVGVTQVYYQLNGTGWSPAATTSGWTNWTAQVTLGPGANVVQAYAEDAAGHLSKTNRVSFVCEVVAPSLSPASLSGMSAQVTSADGSETFTIAFGASTFSQTMLPGANESDNFVGNYSYKVQSANTAQLTATATAPPGHTGSTVVELTFTNTNEAVYSTTGNGGGSTGSVLLSQAPDLAPTSLAGDTVDLVDATIGDSTTVFASGSLTNTNRMTGGVSIGSYTFKPYSPVGGLLTIHFSSPSDLKGFTDYNIITYSAPEGGAFFESWVAPSGVLKETDFGTFTVP